MVEFAALIFIVLTAPFWLPIAISLGLIALVIAIILGLIWAIITFDLVFIAIIAYLVPFGAMGWLYFVFVPAMCESIDEYRDKLKPRYRARKIANVVSKIKWPLCIVITSPVPAYFIIFWFIPLTEDVIDRWF